VLTISGNRSVVSLVGGGLHGISPSPFSTRESSGEITQAKNFPRSTPAARSSLDIHRSNAGGSQILFVASRPRKLKEPWKVTHLIAIFLSLNPYDVPQIPLVTNSTAFATQGELLENLVDGKRREHRCNGAGTCIGGYLKLPGGQPRPSTSFHT